MKAIRQVLTQAEVDRLTFEDFYATEFDRVFDSAYSFCGDRQGALDATQEAFARAFARWWRLSRQWAGAWVTTTALNVLRRAFRKAAFERQTHQTPVSSDPGQRVDVLAGPSLAPGSATTGGDSLLHRRSTRVCRRRRDASQRRHR
jgi:DNA-directed RNA polymerase specialized sigma24 family protein